jgi:tRNA threonylcarbamoyladenosine biosynthesis protein TsaB
MILYIDTSFVDSLEVYLKRNDQIIVKKKVKAKKQQAEKLLKTIDELINKAKINLKDIKEIKVANYGGTFTGLRIGILTANALAFALKIPVNTNQETKKNSKFKLVQAKYEKGLNYQKKSNCG